MDMHVVKLSDLSQTSKSRKLTTVHALSGEDEVEQAKKVEQKRKEEEEEMVRKAEEKKKEEEAVRIKELRRLEERAKGREATERKRLLAEKAQAHAAAKAKKEA